MFDPADSQAKGPVCKRQDKLSIEHRRQRYGTIAALAV